MEGQSFDQMIAPERRALLAHCYRMLGSMADAEDALQETLVRAWKGLPTWEERASFRTWLHRIATNVSIDLAQRRGPRMLQTGEPLAQGQAPGAPNEELPWLEPAPADWLDPEASAAARESMGIAFMSAIQRLPPQQRATLLLRDVLGWSAIEVAELLETTVPAVNSALQRARETMERPSTPRALDDDAMRALLARYASAWESGAPEAFASVLRDDAILTMPPMPGWLRGIEAIAGIAAWIRQSMGELRLVPAKSASGPALAGYVRAPGDSVFRATALHVLETSGDRVIQVHAFVLPRILRRFDVPETLVS